MPQAIDETDRMTEKGHFEELKQLLELINRDEAKMRKRQNFVFSATLSLVHDLPKHLVGKRRAKAVTSEEKLEQVMSTIGVKEKASRKVVDLTSKLGTARTLTESRIHCDVAEKDVYLYYFTQMHPGRTLVFCNSIDCVRRLVNLFSLLRFVLGKSNLIIRFLFTILTSQVPTARIARPNAPEAAVEESRPLCVRSDSAADRLGCRRARSRHQQRPACDSLSSSQDIRGVDRDEFPFRVI